MLSRSNIWVPGFVTFHCPSVYMKCLPFFRNHITRVCNCRISMNGTTLAWTKYTVVFCHCYQTCSIQYQEWTSIKIFVANKLRPYLQLELFWLRVGSQWYAVQFFLTILFNRENKLKLVICYIFINPFHCPIQRTYKLKIQRNLASSGGCKVYTTKK